MGCHSVLQGIFPYPEIRPTSPALAGGFFITEPGGKPIACLYYLVKYKYKHLPMLYTNTHHLLICHFDLSKTVGQFLRRIPGPLSVKRLFCSNKQRCTIKLTVLFLPNGKKKILRIGIGDISLLVHASGPKIISRNRQSFQKMR